MTKWKQNKDGNGIITENLAVNTDSAKQSLQFEVQYQEILNHIHLFSKILYKNNPIRYSEFKECILHIFKKAEEAEEND